MTDATEVPPSSLLAGKRVLVTSAGTYMGPAVVELFRAEGATVVADAGRYLAPGEAEAAVTGAGGRRRGATMGA